MDKTRLQELAGILTEKYEDYSEDQLIDELYSQMVNMQHFTPKKADMSPDRREVLKKEIHKNGMAYVGIAKDIIAIVEQMKKKGLV